MSSSTVEALRAINLVLHSRLQTLGAGATLVPIRAKDFSDLRRDVLRAAYYLRSLSDDQRSKDAELEQQLVQCRKNLMDLAQILPAVHVQLQANKARLQAALDHLRAAGAWADASTNSL
jgi:hypothetical protein